MKLFRYKPVGWRHESYRHYLAAKGIKTKPEQVADVLIHPSFMFFRESVSSEYEEPGVVKVLKHPLGVMRVSDILPSSPFEKGEQEERGEEERVYMMTKERSEELAGSLKSFFDDGRAATPDYARLHRDQLAQSESARVTGELHKLERAGELREGAAERFLEDDFTNETKDFLDHKIDYAAYRANLDRRLEKHKSQHGAKLKLFEW